MGLPKRVKHGGDSKKRPGSETTGPTDSTKKQKQHQELKSGTPNKAGPILDLNTELPDLVETWIHPLALALFKSVKVLSS
jgi:hypothetical protein